jgi:hypothetical protein
MGDLIMLEKLLSLTTGVIDLVTDAEPGYAGEASWPVNADPPSRGPR